MTADPRHAPDRSWYYEVRFRAPADPTTWPASLVILTGFATTGEEWSDPENQAANERLEVELVRSGKWFAPITGYAPASGHAEPGFAAELTPEEGTSLGRKFKQDAIYVVRNGKLWVQYCADEREEAVAEEWLALVD